MNVDQLVPTRRLAVLFTAALAALVFLACSARAQTRASADEPEDDYLAVLTADRVYIRSGAANSYYPFGMLREGALVRVLEEKYNWARVATIGPAFEDMFGYIKQPAADNRLLRLNSDGTIGTTLGRVNVIAANLETGNSPQHSWKPIAHLQPDRELVVLRTIESESQIIYAVAVPEEASGWVSMAHLRPADAAEQRTWEQLIEAPTDEPDATTPRMPVPANTPLAREEPSTPRVTPTPVQPLPAVEDTPVAADAVSPEGEAEMPLIDDDPQFERTGTAQPNLTRVDEEVDDADGAAPQPAVTPATPVQREVQAPRTPADRLAALESAFVRLGEEPIETAEVEVLRDLYVDLSTAAADEKQVAMYARSRAEQLRLWGELQVKQRELKLLRSQLDVAAEDVQSVRYALQTSGSYSAVGRIAASTVYDGTQLPRLYRVQDPGTGRTIAYLRPHEKLDLVGMLDQLVGVIGVRSYDGSLQLHIIDPERIDLLAPQPEQVTRVAPDAGG